MIIEIMLTRIFFGSTVSHDSAIARKPIGAQHSHSHESSERRNAHRQGLIHDKLLNPLPEDLSSSGKLSV